MDTKKGRPPISKERKRITLILPLDDYELLKSICSVTGSKPATMIRSLINDMRPQLISINEGLKAAQSGDSSGSIKKFSDALGKSIDEGQEMQKDMFRDG